MYIFLTHNLRLKYNRIRFHYLQNTFCHLGCKKIEKNDKTVTPKIYSSRDMSIELILKYACKLPT